jgi:hypothetical protein
MLPILRILPVGGVLLAILILVLALSPPDGSRAPLSSAMATGRGVLADRDRQSEARQYLIHAALKRADETNRLRDLPDTPRRAEGRRPAQRPDRRRSGRNRGDPRDAGRHHPDRDRRTLFGRIAPQALPQSSPQEELSSVKKAEQAKPRPDTRRRVYRARPHTRVAAKPPQSRQYNFFEMFFWGPPGQQSTYSTQAQSGSQQPAYAQQDQQPAYGSQQQYYQWPVTNSGQTTQHTYSVGPRSIPY